MAAIVNLRLTNLAGDYVDLVDPYRVNGLDGIGRAPLAHITQRGPYQHGATRIGGNLQPRVITIGIRTVAATPAQMWQYWDAMLKVLQYGNGAATLRVTRQGGEYRDIDVYYDGGLTMPLEPANPRTRQDAVQLVAFDPCFYNPILTSIVCTLNAQTDLHYPGTWQTYPIFWLDGPLEDPVIQNDVTGEKLDFTGYHVADADRITVDLRYGYKTVTSSVAGNVIDKLTSDSDLVTFHVAAHPEEENGLNEMIVTAGGSDGGSLVTILYYERYLSA